MKKKPHELSYRSNIYKALSFSISIIVSFSIINLYASIFLYPSFLWVKIFAIYPNIYENFCLSLLQTTFSTIFFNPYFSINVDLLPGYAIPFLFLLNSTLLPIFSNLYVSIPADNYFNYFNIFLSL